MEIEKKIKIRFKSLSPVLFCRMVPEERKEGETPGNYEIRTWKNRAHYNEEGRIIIPGYLIKRSLEPAAKLLGKRVAGKKMGKSLAAYIRLIQVDGDIVTNLMEETITGLTSFVSANGKIDGGKVPRTYPKITSWEGTLIISYPTIANALNEDLVLEHLTIAGSYIGIGHWRPGSPSCGNFGRFSVEKIG